VFVIVGGEVDGVMSRFEEDWILSSAEVVNFFANTSALRYGPVQVASLSLSL
jgi:hypothetical protein